MQFKYTATNPEAKRLTGIINAADETTARTELNHLGFSILEINAVNETAMQIQSEMEKFEFEAIDKSGKKIKGTIPAKTNLLAYKRLVNEYHFNVLFLIQATATELEKQTLRTTGIETLKNQYDLETHELNNSPFKTVVETPEFLARKKVVIDEVDLILNRIKTLLTTFEAKLSPEKNALIQGYIDKLLRIKASNNLDYILNTCKDLLKRIQDEEMFLKTQEHDQERQSILLESQQMMMELNKSMAPKLGFVADVQSKLVSLKKKLQGSSLNFLVGPIQSLENYFKDPPELASIETELRVLKSKRWDAIHLAFKSPKETRGIAIDSVRKMLAQEKIIKHKIKAVQELRHEKNLIIRHEKHLYLVEEISVFTGWLLLFYLGYYFLGHYVLLKNLPIHPVLSIPFDLGESVLFKYLLPIIFLLHAAATLKMMFFIKSRLADPILIVLTFFLSLMVVFNF